MEQNGNVRLTVIIVILLLIVLLYNFQSTDTVWYYLNDLDQEIISGGSYSEIQKSKIDIHLSRIDVFETTKNFKELLPTINYFYITGEVQREMEVVNIFIVENECVTHEKVTIEGLDNTIFVDVPESAEVYIGFNMPSFGYDWMLGVNENYNTTDFKVIQQKLERTELLKPKLKNEFP